MMAFQGIMMVIAILFFSVMLALGVFFSSGLKHQKPRHPDFDRIEDDRPKTLQNKKESDDDPFDKFYKKWNQK